jgi:5'-3' exonuclease
MQKYHDAKMYAKWEADDMCCMILHKGADDPDTQYILAAIDKDLYQMRGLHFNPNKKEEGVYPVSEVEGWYAFYIQMLMGDTADHIKGLSGTKGCPGIGQIGAAKLLANCTTIEQMCEVVWKAYQEKWPTPFKLQPWWWSDEWEDDDKDMLKQRATKGRKRKTITVDAQYMFRETADLLYMLRYPEDQYTPHIKFVKWKPYPNGIVQHVLGD